MNRPNPFTRLLRRVLRRDKAAVPDPGPPRDDRKEPRPISGTPDLLDRFLGRLEAPLVRTTGAVRWHGLSAAAIRRIKSRRSKNREARKARRRNRMKP